jgi:hypothetical protein
MKKLQMLSISLAMLLLGMTTQGQSLVDVQANQPSVSTGIHVTKGETYRITAEGEWQDAGFPPSDANGFKGFTAPMFFGMLLKPLPGQYYMKLCGKVGGWKFPIGTERTVKIKRTGELILFANDAKGFFDNNSGTITVTIIKLE